MAHKPHGTGWDKPQGWDEDDEKNGIPQCNPSGMSSLQKDIKSFLLYEDMNLMAEKDAKDAKAAKAAKEHDFVIIDGPEVLHGASGHPCSTGCKYYIKFLDYGYTEEGLRHFRHYRHEQQTCRFGPECYPFNRLKNKGNRLDDKCHCELFSHGPDSRVFLPYEHL
jgi:hypothetical protein